MSEGTVVLPKLVDTATVSRRICEFRKKVIQYQPIKLLNILNFYSLFQHRKCGIQCWHSREKDIALKLFQYVLAIFESTNIIHEEALKEPEYEDVIEIVDSFSSLINDFDKRDMAIISSLKDSDLVFGQKLCEKVDGKTYACFAEPIVEMLLQTQGALFEQVYKLDLDSLNFGLRQLAEKTLVLPIDHFTQQAGTTFYDAFQRIKNFSPIERFDVKLNTNWPDELICDLSCEIGADKDFFTREQFPGYLDIEMPISKHSFIRYAEHSYCFNHNILFDHLYRNLRRALISHNKNITEVWNRNQKIVSEGLVAGMLQNVFKGANIYQNNYYKNDSNWSENDIIINFFNFIFVVEIKAGAYTPRSVVLDSPSHDAAIEALIDDPFYQANRTEEYIKSTKETIFYDSDHKEKFRFPNNDKTEIIKLAITIDAIGEISAGINYNGHNQTPENPVIALSLHDFNVYCCFFDSPIYFLHFFLQRRKISHNSILIDDELNYLGSYLEKPDYNEFFDDQEPNTKIILTELYEDVDIYFSSWMQKKLKPKFSTDPIVTKCIYKIPINYCGAQIGVQLLNFTKSEQLTLVENFQHILRRQKQTGHFAHVLLKPTDNTEYPITVFCNQGKRYATDYKVHEYATAIAEAFGFNTVLYVVIEWGKWPSIKKITCGKAEITEALEYESKKFLQIVNYIKYTGNKQ